MYIGFLSMLTTYILTSPNPVTHPQFYDCSEFFANQTDRPLINATIPTETYESANNVSRIFTLIFCATYFLRFVLEGSIFVILKVS